jgi:hypothetical protein
MKKYLTFMAITCFVSGYLFSQQQVRGYNENVAIPAISFTSDGKYMIVGGYAKIYNMTLGEVDFRTIKKDTETQSDYAFNVCISPDDRTFIVTKLKRLEIWDLQSRAPNPKKTIRDGQLAVRAACFSTDNKYIIYMRLNGEIVFINTSSLAESHKIKSPAIKPTALAPSPDGKKLFIGTRSGIIIAFDINTRDFSPLSPSRITRKSIYNVAFPQTGDYIAVSSADGKIWLGEYPSLKPVRLWQAHEPGYTPIAFHPSGKYLASAGKDKATRIWNIPDCSKKESDWKDDHKLPLLSLAFSPDGSVLASGSLSKFGGNYDTMTRSFAGSTYTSSAPKKNVQAVPIISAPSKVIKAGASPQKRLALLIGNGQYQNSILANPENDAREMKSILLQYGFDVLEYENLSQSQMKMAMDEFGDKLKNYDVGLFFYAGHGIQSKGYNYLIPVDANIKSEEQVEYDCVQADRILALMESSGTDVNIIILDACRNNPFERSWTRSANGKGLAFMNAPKGSLIAYATAPGSTASDGSGRNGLYTSALLESIRIPDINILQVFQNVRVIVSDKSGGQQIPWESTSLTGDFIF